MSTMFVQPVPVTNPVRRPVGTPTRPRRVVLTGVGDVVAAGLRAVMSDCAWIEISTSTAPFNEAATADVLIVDLEGAARAGAAAPEYLVRPRPGLTVLAIAPDDRPDLGRRALAYGAHGLLSLSSWPADVVVSTIQAATHGRVVRPAALVVPLTKIKGRGHGTPDDGETLSPRELQVLRLIASGRSNIEIAEELFVSVNTIKTYVRGAYRHINVRTRSQASLWCFEHGLTSSLPVSSVALSNRPA